MNCKLEQTLTEVMEETFISMAFMLPVEEAAADEDQGASRLYATITFSGPFSGSLFLSIPHCMMPVLAANILGSEPNSPVPVNEQQDALKEVLNVICGNLLPKISAPREVFDVHQPRIVSEEEVVAVSEVYGNDDPEAMANLHLECGDVVLVLWLDQPGLALYGHEQELRAEGEESYD
jgi:hypothetical protein